ncbi:glycosyl transferase family protein [Novosphingopyxis sp.]|uniref:glycosyl transferase family protein n=1 Tax=Novosphingopyxis sp. TaxID=2709690 RepID=UPI003B5A7E43
MGEWLNCIELAQHELLLFCGIGFVIGAADDIAIDLLWVVRRCVLALRGCAPSRYLGQLGPPRGPGPIAIFLPLWDESAVVGRMLEACGVRWQGQDYRIFAGVYPNDPATRDAVTLAAARDPRVHLIVNGAPDPTTKADCLNHLWRALIAFEAERGLTVKAVVLHDAEDLVHTDELALFDRLIEDFELVQLPVRAVPVPGSRLVSGHYRDEFIEAHDKQLVVRSWLGAGLPSAGVGCAFSRAMLETIAAREGGLPFCAESLTEDYELGLKVRELEGRQTIVHLAGRDGSLICTRCCFPGRFVDSARQKARWLTGISLAGWDRLGWTRCPAECWMRFRDRRSVFAAFLLLAAYVTGALTLTLWIAVRWLPDYRPQGLSGEADWLVTITALALLWRVVVRCWLVARACGWREALWSPARLLTGNLIAIVAATRALRQYIGYCLGSRLTWEKTSHYFPEADDLAPRPTPVEHLSTRIGPAMIGPAE